MPPRAAGKVGKPRGLTPVQRTAAHLRAEDRVYEIVERWVPMRERQPDGSTRMSGFRQDKWGADIQVLDGRPGVLGINACTDNGGAAAEHVRKAMGLDKVAHWLAGGNRFEVWAWGLRGPKTQKRWTLRRIALRMDPAGEIYTDDSILKGKHDHGNETEAQHEDGPVLFPDR